MQERERLGDGAPPMLDVLSVEDGLPLGWRLDGKALDHDLGRVRRVFVPEVVWYPMRLSEPEVQQRSGSSESGLFEQFALRSLEVALMRFHHPGHDVPVALDGAPHQEEPARPVDEDGCLTRRPHGETANPSAPHPRTMFSVSSQAPTDPLQVGPRSERHILPGVDDAVAGVSGHDVYMHMEHGLEARWLIRLIQRYPGAPKSFSLPLRDLPCRNSDGPEVRRPDVEQSAGVALRDHERMALCRWLDGQERERGRVLANDNRRLVASDDPAEGARRAGHAFTDPCPLLRRASGHLYQL